MGAVLNATVCGRIQNYPNWKMYGGK